MTEIAGDKTYKFVDRFGLPTFFALIMFGLVVYLGRGFVDVNKENAASNVLKLQYLHEIRDKEDEIIANQRTIVKLHADFMAEQRLWAQEHEALDRGQNEILKRLDEERRRGGR